MRRRGGNLSGAYRQSAGDGWANFWAIFRGVTERGGRGWDSATEFRGPRPDKRNIFMSRSWFGIDKPATFQTSMDR